MVAPERRVHDLLGIVQSYAPTGTDQAYCATELNAAALAGAKDSAQMMLLAGWLLDGLRYGNWPWVIRDLPPTEVTAIWMDRDEINKE